MSESVSTDEASSGPAQGRAAKGVVNEAREQAGKARRRKLITLSSIIVAVVVIGGGTVFGVYEATKKPAYQTPLHVSKSAAGLIVAGSGHTVVEVYADYQCAACQTFAQQTSATLTRLLASNSITLVIHPVATMDAMSTTQYSTRAASATACASDMHQAFAFYNLMLAARPQPHTAGLSDDQIVQIGGRTGIIDPRFAQCVRAGTYRAWVTHVNKEAATQHVGAVPTVLVNGHAVAPAGTAPTAAALTAAIGAAA
jgi:protein-disulfide isomerase